MNEARRVSAIAPCRNEGAHLGAFVDAVRGQQLPPGWTLELVVADGASDDGSRERLAEIAAREPWLTVVDNPQRIVSTGLNRALDAARGEVIVRMDLHTTYASDYVAQCLATLERTGADNVGGPWRAQGEGPWGRAIAAAFQSRWVAGGAASRSLTYEGPVDTVYLGCWPRATFERFGRFDESLVRNQDDEHNLRIVRGGGRVWQSPAIRSSYRPRESLGAFARQWLQYGYWKPFVMRRHGQPASVRHLLPALFVAALAFALLAVPLGAGVQPLALLLAAYAAALVLLSATVVVRLPLTSWWRLPVVVAVQHLAYGAGTLVGAWDAWRHGRGRERFARLTR